MEVGLIKWFSEDKGFGVLKTPDNNEVFLHISNWNDPQEFSMDNHAPIIFKVGFKRNKITALNCTYFDSKNIKHWNKIFSLSKYSYSIKINNIHKNILELALSNLDDDFDVSLIKPFLSNTLNSLKSCDLLNYNQVIYSIYRNINNNIIKASIFEDINFKINLLSDFDIFKFWRANIIPDFVPKPKILIKFHNEIPLSDLKNIKKVETRNLIILIKIDSLKKEFNLNEYINFQKHLEYISPKDFKNKIVTDLNFIANSQYLNFIAADLIKITKDPNANCHKFKKFITDLPNFLPIDFFEKLTKILTTEVVKNCSFKTIIDCWEENLIRDLGNTFFDNLKNQNNDDLVYFLKSNKCDINIAEIILNKLLEEKSLY